MFNLGVSCSYRILLLSHRHKSVDREKHLALLNYKNIQTAKEGLLGETEILFRLLWGFLIIQGLRVFLPPFSYLSQNI